MLAGVVAVAAGSAGLASFEGAVFGFFSFFLKTVLNLPTKLSRASSAIAARVKTLVNDQNYPWLGLADKSRTAHSRCWCFFVIHLAPGKGNLVGEG